MFVTFVQKSTYFFYIYNTPKNLTFFTVFSLSSYFLRQIPSKIGINIYFFTILSYVSKRAFALIILPQNAKKAARSRQTV
jgi:hypothetical protein